MISNLETKSSERLSEELSDIFNHAVQEIKVSADLAPDQIVESVHLIRKRLKFLRAFVKLIRFCTSDDNYKAVNYILRDCGRVFSDCRDAHVRELLLDEFSQNESLSKVVQELIKSNKIIANKLESNLLNDSNIFEELTSEITQKDVKNYISSLEPNAKCLSDGLTLGYEKSYHAFHSELEKHEADLLHEWRKRTKDLQYQLEALLKSVPAQLSPSYEDIAALCEILGRINDLFMFLEWLDSVEDSIQAHKQLKQLRITLKKELKTLENQADTMGESLLTWSPEKYRNELNSQLKL